MKAVACRRYGTPDILEILSIQNPTCGPGDVLLRVRATVVSTADAVARKGEPWFARLFFGLSRPKQPVFGSELAGVVEAVGDKVTRFTVGDEVLVSTGDAFGGHAEFVVLPEKAAIARKPTGLDFAEAAAIVEGALTALPFLRDHGKVIPGMEVLINGASGTVGSAAVQLAKILGAEVTAVCSGGNAEWVAGLGADRVIDYTQVDFAREGKTYDVIFDAVGKRSFSECKSALKSRGAYLTTVMGGRILLDMALSSLVRGRRAALALTGLRSAFDKIRDMDQVREWTEAGKLKAVIDCRLPLEKAAEAHRRVDSGHKKGSVVLEPVLA